MKNLLSRILLGALAVVMTAGCTDEKVYKIKYCHQVAQFEASGGIMGHQDAKNICP